MDLSRSAIEAFIKNFDNLHIILYYYHFITRIIIHLPQLKSQNKKIKKKHI